MSWYYLFGKASQLNLQLINHYLLGLYTLSWMAVVNSELMTPQRGLICYPNCSFQNLWVEPYV